MEKREDLVGLKMEDIFGTEEERYQKLVDKYGSKLVQTVENIYNSENIKIDKLFFLEECTGPIKGIAANAGNPCYSKYLIRRYLITKKYMDLRVAYDMNLNKIEYSEDILNKDLVEILEMLVGINYEDGVIALEEEDTFFDILENCICSIMIFCRDKNPKNFNLDKAVKWYLNRYVNK